MIYGWHPAEVADLLGQGLEMQIKACAKILSFPQTRGHCAKRSRSSAISGQVSKINPPTNETLAFGYKENPNKAES